MAEEEFVELGEKNVYRSVLQRFAACCSVCEWREWSEVCCNVTGGGNKVYSCSVLQHVAVCCNVSVLQVAENQCVAM